MSTLTTRQRDLLCLLLDANEPLATATVAQQLQLTSRQVIYSLKGVHGWLAQYHVQLAITPGIGAQLICTPEEAVEMSAALQSDNNYQLVLSPSQRQQLFLFHLLTASEPLILYQLQRRAQVSRSTILKDLAAAEPWLQPFDLRLERRPNYGIEIVGSEQSKRQALVARLWSNATLGDPLWGMTHTHGLVFTFDHDATLLPILKHVKQVVDQIKAHAAIAWVAQAEAALGGRFSDVAVLHLALALAVQQQRAQQGFFLEGDSAENPLTTHPIWPTADRIFQAQNISPPDSQLEIASIAMYLLSSARNDRWPADLESESVTTDLIKQMMALISDAYELPNLLRDSTLRDGLIAHVIPACMRHKYGLWSPPPQSNRLQNTYVFELKLADQLSALIADETGAHLPPHEVNNLALLIRAAFIRERPNRVKQVVVVCPSGMATAQLLTARLKARFPRLGSLKVLSMRELNDEALDSAELILTTVPLPENIVGTIKAIQVHPLLLPEDIETITQWLA